MQKLYWRDCEIEADEGIYSVFDNLFRNAVEHGGARRIEVVSEPTEDGCIIHVKNDGHGIPEEIAGRIFDRGFTSSQNHSGLGLFIVKLIVERYGGKIDLISNEPVTFRIFLPKIDFGLLRLKVEWKVR